MGNSGDRPIRALAVDLPNLCIETDTPVYMGNNLRPPLLFADILDMMRDLYAFNFNVPIFFIIDARVQPHAMSTAEAQLLLDMERRDSHDLERIWRMRRRLTGGSSRETTKAKEKEKADFAMCDLANRLDVALITEDRLLPEAESGRLQRPDDLIRFVPRRSSRDEQFRFVPATRRTETRSLASLVAPLTDDEYWDEWARCVKVLAPHMEREQKKWDLECIKYVRDTRVATVPAPAVVPEPSAVAEPTAVAGSVASSVEPLARTSEPPVPAPLVPVAAFVFGDLRDLAAHRNSVVEMIGRAFRTDSGLEFRLYAAGMGVKVELADSSVDLHGASFISATGQLDFDGRAWILRDARINGSVSNEEVHRLKDSGQGMRRGPGFSDWGRSPRWRWARRTPPTAPQPTPAEATPAPAQPSRTTDSTAPAQLPTQPQTSEGTTGKTQQRDTRNQRSEPTPEVFPPGPPAPAGDDADVGNSGTRRTLLATAISIALVVATLLYVFVR